MTTSLYQEFIEQQWFLVIEIIFNKKDCQSLHL